MNFEIKKEVYDEIAREIHSDSSPVGIDAKKTHILILKMLMDIDERLSRLESEIQGIRPGRPNSKA